MFAPKYIGKEILVKVDRPLHSTHPTHNFKYELNYGYIPNTVSGDGEELDAYIIGIDEPVKEFKGTCIAVIHRTNDNDDKLIIAPTGKNYSDQEILSATHFQEQWFDSIIIRNSNITKTHFGIYGVSKKEGKILVIKKSRGPYTGLYDLPGGSPEKKESETETLIREIKEETNCDVVSYENRTEHTAIFSDFTPASCETGTLLHSAVLYDAKIEGTPCASGDNIDSNGAIWIDIKELNIQNSTPFLLLSAGIELASVADSNNNPIGYHQRGLPLSEGRFAMLACVIVFNSKGNIILHKIASHKTWGGLWTYSAAGHVDMGESYEQAAKRELSEELGITTNEVAEITTIPFYRDGKHTGFHNVYKTSSDGPYNPDRNEIAELREFTAQELADEINKSPENFFPELLIALKEII